MPCAVQRSANGVVYMSRVGHAKPLDHSGSTSIWQSVPFQDREYVVQDGLQGVGTACRGLPLRRH